MGTYTTSDWISSLGYDDACSAVPGTSSCAWFTWNERDISSVSWGAVGANGNTSGRIGMIAGAYQASGATGLKYLGSGPWVRVRLIAWIDVSRSFVYSAFMNGSGSIIGSTLTVRAVPSPYHAWQTYVAWSQQDQRWLVAWSEQYPYNGYNGRVLTRYVTTEPSLGPAANHIMYCEGPQTDRCAGGGSSSIVSPGIGVVRSALNDTCVCKGFYLASSDSSTSSNDRYRLQQYDRHVRLNSNGERTTTPYYTGCGIWCPVATAEFANGQATFQQLLRRVDAETGRWVLYQDSDLHGDEEYAMGARYNTPQALRATGDVTLAVSARMSDDRRYPDNSLRLSILDSRYGGCP